MLSVVLALGSFGTVKSQAVCGTDILVKRRMEQDPEYRRSIEEREKWISEYVATHPLPKAAKGQAPLHTIPLVVHIIHTGGAIGTIYNPSDATIQATVAALNNFYNGTGMIGVGDMQIQFVLATRNNTCQTGTNGIVRFNASSYTSYVNNGVNLYGTTGVSDEFIKTLSTWDTRNYYHIWVVNKIDGADGTGPGVFTGGYAYTPGIKYTLDGTVMLATQMQAASKTLPHEIGHAFALEHPFEGYTAPSTCPTNTNCATQGDYICDTDPITMPPDYSTCRTGTNPCTGNPYNDNTERNVMNYTNCYDLFTAGQKARVLATAAGPFRKSLTQSYGISSSYPLTSFPAISPTVTPPATQTVGLSNDYIGIGKVSLNGMEFSSSYPWYDNNTSGYFDRTGSCHQIITLTAGNTYTLTVQSLGTYALQAKAWLDYNGNGTLDNTTEVLGTAVVENAEPTSGQATFTFTVPNSISPRKTLRLRISMDVSTYYTTMLVSSLTSPTQQPKYGQVEDYPVYITPPTVTWTGGASTTNWLTAGNWDLGFSPPSNYDIVIPDVTTDPEFTSDQTYHNVTVQNGGRLTTGLWTLTVKGNLSNSGAILSNSVGKVTMNGSDPQTISGNGDISILYINNSNGVSIQAGSHRQRVTDVLSPNAGTLTTNGNLTLASTSTNTARVLAPSSGGQVSGNVTVERYIPSGRKWRLLSAPVIGGSTNSIFQNWQNNDNVTGSTGSEIWGPAGDADPGSANSGMTLLSGSTASLMKYTSGGWTAVTNTNTEPLFDANTNNGFAMFVTGPYANGTSNVTTGAAATTLSATGSLVMGNHTKSLGTAAANQYFLVGNPYASPVQPHLLGFTNLNATMWMWDARVAGNYTLGRYVSYNRTSQQYSTTDLASGYQNNFIPIQSGQAFFVQATSAGSASILFEEVDKTTTVTGLMFGNSTERPRFETVRLTLQQQVDGENIVTDGAVTYFKDGANPGLDSDDGAKMMNASENMWLRRNEADLTFDFRPTIRTADTIRVMLGNMRKKAYRLSIDAHDFTDPSTLSARLLDRYLGTTVPLALQSVTEYPFTVDERPESTGERFAIILGRASSFIQMINMRAGRKGMEVGIEWSASDDASVRDYLIERSSDGVNFLVIGRMPSHNKAGTYRYRDEAPMDGTNTYRVRAEHQDGSVKSSEMASVEFEGNGRLLTAYPNPATSRVRVILSRVSEETYVASVLSASGTEVWKVKTTLGGIKRLDIPLEGLPAGAYRIVLQGETGKRYAAQFLKQ